MKLKDEEEPDGIDISNLPNLIRRTSPFKNIISLTCKSEGSGVSCERLWVFLGLAETSFPQLQCLTISRIVSWISSSDDPPVRPNSKRGLAVGKQTGSLKEIRVSLEVVWSNGHHIDEFFGKIVETFGMEAVGLVSEIDVHLEDTGAGRRYRRQTGNAKYLKVNKRGNDGRTFEEGWRVNNLRRLRFTDYEGLYLISELIYVDGDCFKKLKCRFQAGIFGGMRFLKEISLKSPTSQVPFPNVEIFKLDTRTVAEAYRTIKSSNKSGDNKWFRDLLDESLIFFPRLRDFRVGTENMRRCYIERNPDGELVIGEDFFVENRRSSPSDEIQWEDLWI
ncbi:hypothetical protein TWF569_011698 [Orbilia oligospora]|uniref:Uncharacterized protein n=1 Tax=Orbilia oligospora TaxID=2813651 RepID=A0A7C8N6Y1_ORBOL|nr:hypothetical protein TWF102_009717 [Orbilia oligospora]KAF3101489.1 hypothetical protein TWF103_007907 [Orbilia oligospora]KAF3127755.1 hypothetical protein TWF569_011698 [Orbilia oligospora]KAF3148610.1 hypothetical protein TWF594_001021 [Orbilia oligospora]